MKIEKTVKSKIDILFMQQALDEAVIAAKEGEVPVGAVIVDEQNQILASAGNRSIAYSDPSAHAELLALRAAGKKINNYRLIGATLYVTLEPCLMCVGAMIHARISRLVFGATDPKTGAIVSRYTIGSDGRLNHSFMVEGGLLASESAGLLKEFFKKRRG